MELQSELSAVRNRYARETQRRIGRTISNLAAIVSGQGGDTTGVLRLLHEQGCAAEAAGFSNIARLCRNMAEYFDEACREEDARAVAVAASLVDSCRTVDMHAEAVANSLRHFGDDGTFCPHSATPARKRGLPTAVPC